MRLGVDPAALRKWAAFTPVGGACGAAFALGDQEPCPGAGGQGLSAAMLAPCVLYRAPLYVRDYPSDTLVRHRRRWLAGVAVVAVLSMYRVEAASAAPANALPKSTAAAEHLRRGNIELDLDHWDAAVAEYERGAQLDPVPMFFHNIALAHRRAGRYDNAIRAYRTFLSKISDDPHYADIKAEIDLVIADLENAASRPPNQPEPASASTSATEDRTRLAVASPSPARVDRWYEDGLGWGLAGGGLVAAALGGGFLIRSDSLEGEARRESDQSESRRLLDQSESWSTAGTVTIVAGGVLLGAGIIKLAISPRPATVSISPQPGGASAAVTLRF